MQSLRLLFVIGILLAAVLTSGVVFAQQADVVPGEVLVKFKAGVTAREIGTTLDRLSSTVLHRFSLVENLHHIRLPAGLRVTEALEVLRKVGIVEYAEPNYIRHATRIGLLPNDPGLSYLWGLENTGQSGGTADADIDAPEAWTVTTGDPDTVIAVIDTGADMVHVDLAANIWTNPDEIAGNGIDDDHNGYVDDIHGWDFFQNDNDPSDTNNCRHGTHVSGTIGAVGDNSIGVVGVNWQVKILPLRFLGGFLCSGSDANAIKAIDYAAAKGIRVSNNSWGGGGYTRALEEAIRHSGMVFVAAAGNGGADGIGDNNDAKPSYPASFGLDNILSVAATDRNDEPASFSNYGTASVDLSAPGVDIASTVPGNGYDGMSGTSMATPHVSGAVGLLLSQDPAIENWKIMWKLLQSVDKKGLPVLSGGRLNVYNALVLSDPVMTRYEESTASYTGAWSTYSDPGFSNGAVRYSGMAGAAAEFAFTGSGIVWRASKAPILGFAAVFIDNAYQTTIDLYNPAVLHQEAVYTNYSLTQGAHTLKIVATGEKNPSATNSIVDLDAVEVVD